MHTSHDIFEETACPSHRQLQDYLDGNLGTEELYEVERHLSSCTFCSEALDGLSEMEYREHLPAILKEMRRRFRKQIKKHRVAKNTVRGYIWLTVIVFVIIAILLLAYYAIRFTMKGEHQHQRPKTELMEQRR